MQLIRQSKTIWRGRFDFSSPPYSIRLADEGGSALCADASDSAVYRLIWTSATSFTLAPDTFGHEKCTARRELFGSSSFQLAR